MSNISALNAGLAGIQRGLEKANESASQIANVETMSSEDPVKVAEPLVSLMMARLEVEASARVVEAADETLGTLLNTKA